MNKLEGLAILGHGNQASVWAQNLRDQGHPIWIILRPGSRNIPAAQAAGHQVLILGEDSLSHISYVAVLIPDHVIAPTLIQWKANFNQDCTFIYAHGFAVCYEHVREINANWGHLLLAPKAIAKQMREHFKQKLPIPAVSSFEFSNNIVKDELFIKTLAQGIGINVGPYPASFEDETKADLFSEQALLCSIIPKAASECFNLLIKKGISKELAYLECWYELKLIVDAMTRIGPTQFFDLISPNALIGAAKGEQKLIDEDFKSKLEDLWNDIEDKKYLKQIRLTDIDQLKKNYAQFWENDEIEKTHRELGSNLYS